MAVTWIFNPLPDIFSGYLAGWVFWLLGLFFAWRVPSTNLNIKVPLLSIFLIFFASKELRLGATILDVLHIKNPGEAITFGDMTILPICCLLFAIVANRFISSNLYRYLYVIALLMPLSVISYSFLKNHGFKSDNYTIAAIEIFLAIVFYWIKSKLSILDNLAFLGSLSYGIYIFHSPLIYLVRDNFPIAGDIWSYLLRFISWAILTVSLAYLMDLKVQPKIRNWFQINVFVRFAKNNV